jgi:hypothetical protein
LHHPRVFGEIPKWAAKTKKPPKLLIHKHLGTIISPKFDVSTYGVTTYDELFFNPSYLAIAHAVPIVYEIEKSFVKFS